MTFSDVAVIALAFLSTAFITVHANPLDHDRHVCTGFGTWAEERSSCTTLILSGLLNLDDQAWAYSRRGFANMFLHQPVLAIQDYDQVIRLKPNDGDAYLLRGLVKKRLGNSAGAKADLAKACALDPKRNCIAK